MKLNRQFKLEPTLKIVKTSHKNNIETKIATLLKQCYTEDIFTLFLLRKFTNTSDNPGAMRVIIALGLGLLDQYRTCSGLLTCKFSV